MSDRDERGDGGIAYFASEVTHVHWADRNDGHRTIKGAVSADGAIAWEVFAATSSDRQGWRIKFCPWCGIGLPETLDAARRIS